MRIFVALCPMCNVYATKESSEVTITARVFPLCCEILCDNRHVMNLTEGPIIQLRHFRHCVMLRFCSRKIF